MGSPLGHPFPERLTSSLPHSLHRVERDLNKWELLLRKEGMISSVTSQISSLILLENTKSDSEASSGRDAWTNFTSATGLEVLPLMERAGRGAEARVVGQQLRQPRAQE